MLLFLCKHRETYIYKWLLASSRDVSNFRDYRPREWSIPNFLSTHRTRCMMAYLEIKESLLCFHCFYIFSTAVAFNPLSSIV